MNMNQLVVMKRGTLVLIVAFTVLGVVAGVTAYVGVQETRRVVDQQGVEIDSIKAQTARRDSVGDVIVRFIYKSFAVAQQGIDKNQTAIESSDAELRETRKEVQETRRVVERLEKLYNKD